MVGRFRRALLQDRLFSIALLIALASSIITVPKMEYIDWKVMCCLFNLSAILLALEELHVLDRISIQILSSCQCQRSLSLVLVTLTFISAMFITNDMALLTMVPLTLVIAKKAGFDPGFTVILQALGANIGSSLTPIGSPQNLFLFSYYQLSLYQFLIIMLPFVLLGAVWLWILNHLTDKNPLDFELERAERVSRKRVIPYLLLFAAAFLSVIRVLDYRAVTIMVLLALVLWDRHLFRRIDYCLLGTFVCFFIIVGNISHIDSLSTFFSQTCMSSAGSYMGSILLSQVVSNVPSAIFISHFTRQWEAVLLGVNVGGLGTLIASMASVIAYRLYKREYTTPSYLGKFLFYNFISLMVFSITMYYI